MLWSWHPSVSVGLAAALLLSGCLSDGVHRDQGPALATPFADDARTIRSVLGAPIEQLYQGGTLRERYRRHGYDIHVDYRAHRAEPDRPISAEMPKDGLRPAAGECSRNLAVSAGGPASTAGAAARLTPMALR